MRVARKNHEKKAEGFPGAAVASPAPPDAPWVKVALLVGDNHTRHCGVKDYARTLAHSLKAQGIEAEVFAPASWNVRSLRTFRESLRAGAYDVLHVQYPSVGCRGSLIPHLLGVMRIAPVCVATLHEYQALPLAQRISLHLFRWTASALVWVSDFERRTFNGVAGKLGASQTVIPLGSNVPAAPVVASVDNTVVYFGQIRPDKGLEEFLQLATLCRATNQPFRFHVIGSATAAHTAYAERQQSEADPQVQWSFDLPFAEVAELLSRSWVAYLPFPDGASERRGSLLAALLNGLPVISRKGPATTASLAKVFLNAPTPAAAFDWLLQLSAQPDERERMSQISRLYAGQHAWQDVAEQHAALYLEVSQGRPRRSSLGRRVQ